MFEFQVYFFTVQKRQGIFTFVVGLMKKVQLLYAAVNKSWFWKTSLNRPWKLLLLAPSYRDLDCAGASEMDFPWSHQSNLSVVVKMMVAESTCSTLLPEVIYPWQRGACFDASLSMLRLCCYCLESGWICTTVTLWAQVTWKHGFSSASSASKEADFIGQGGA